MGTAAGDMHPVDVLNWLGRTRSLRPIGWIVLRIARWLGLARLLRLAGRRVVTAPAGAPAIILTSGNIGLALSDAQLLYEAMEFTVRQMKLDIICLVADLSLEAEACGCQVRFSPNALPSVVGHLVRDTDDVAHLTVPDPHQAGRMPVFLETMRRLARNYSMVKAACVTGPFTLAMQLCGPSIFVDTLKDPHKVLRVLEYCETIMLSYGRALIEAGTDFLVITEPAVSQLSKQAYERYSRPFSERVAAALRRPCILHVCGKAEHLIEDMCASDWAGISIDDVDIPSLVNRVPKRMAIVGNLSPQWIRYNSADEVRNKTMELLAAVRMRKEFLACPGCDLAPGTTLENVTAFVDAVKGYR
jgi:MtaA/CmuA family methyltransferase